MSFLKSRPSTATCLSLAVCALLPSCEKEPSKSASSPSSVAPSAPAASAVAHPKDKLSEKVEALTGAPTRVVWSHHIGTGTPDPFCNGASHQLQGIDTRDGQGVRLLIAKKSNYSRPLITPDGAQILYTRKLVTRSQKDPHVKDFDMTIMATDWQGAEPREIAPGYALDVWKDPADGRLWVYAAREVPPTYRTSWAAKKLVRFALDEPAKVETVWDQTEISPDNTQFSADGKRASGQAPWPHGGQYVFGQGVPSFIPTVTGCWSAMAPDNSYLSWMLDGNHRMVTLFTAAPQKKTWLLKLSEIAGLEKGEIYHPRWTNHARFITLTGPYLAERGGEGSIISKGGRTAEVVIAKLNASATGFEGSVTLTKDNHTDAYPDVWIAGGETATLGAFPQGLAAATSKSAWPTQTDHLAFLWEALGQPNQIRLPEGKNLECYIEPEGTALFGRHLDMQLLTGSFKPSALAQAHISKILPAAKTWTLEAALLPPSLPHQANALSGPLLTLPGWKIELAGGELILNGRGLAHPPISPPSHIAFRYDGSNATVFLNGKPLSPLAIAALPDTTNTQFGGGAIALGLQGLALHTSALDDATLQEASSYWQTRLSENMKAAPPRVRLRAKLTETTGVPTAEGIAPYTRAMIAYAYDVEEVIEGHYDGKQILVCHWALMNEKACTGFPRKLGESYELTVEPLDLEKHHPELEGQRVFDDTTAFDLEKWYDIALPQL